MTEEQKKLLDSLQTEFDTLWNKFCEFFPEIQSMFSHKELTKMRGKYAAKYKALCDSRQEIVTSSCLFDEFISSFGNGNQAKDFKEAAGITGIVLTKLDGTAKGGVVLAINNELDVPVKFVGVGERIEDLQPFDADAFASALFDAKIPDDDREITDFITNDNSNKNEEE